MGDLSNGGQGFAAESKSLDVEQIVGGHQFAGGMGRDGQMEFFLGYAAAVIRDAYQIDTATFDRQLDSRRARINAIFQHLFDDTGRTLDNLSSGNLVD